MKRGQSGLSLVIAVDKPSGKTSHDVVDACRKIFGERRVGHTGTLDPLASGVLPICIGNATRLSNYMTQDVKQYVATIAFGTSTTTNDSEGEVIRTASPKAKLFDAAFAKEYLRSILGEQMQIPPAYSAIKIAGKKACDSARKGVMLNLEPRPIEIFEANLLDVRPCGQSGFLEWDVAFKVSKGTYIRSISRDAGNALNCPAHMSALRRTSSGLITLENCVSLEALKKLRCKAAIDPVAILGMRVVFAGEDVKHALEHGNEIPASKLKTYEYDKQIGGCGCISNMLKSSTRPHQGELFSIVNGNKLAAIYRFDSEKDCLKAQCVFHNGISRGSTNI